MISLHNLSLRRGIKLLFENANFTLYQHQKVGIVGKNGCGKSSLFSLILNEIQPEHGSLHISKDTRIAHVMQTIPHTRACHQFAELEGKSLILRAPQRSIHCEYVSSGAQKISDFHQDSVELMTCPNQEAIEYVIDGDEKLRTIQKNLKIAEQEQQGDKIAQLHTELEDANGYTAFARAAKLLDGLGFTAKQMHNKVLELSGGWQMRLNLARALMQPSDILLLDEPTNHLDLDAVIWLEQWLRQYSGMLLLISHDREFLDRITTQTMHFENKKITLYSGNYTQFLKQKTQIEEIQEKTVQKQQKHREHLQSYIDRFRYKASKAKQAQSRIKMLARMETTALPFLEQQFTFEFLEPATRPHTLIELKNLNFGYTEKLILNNINLKVTADMRIGLLGRNGAGKSTLLKILAGVLEPESGIRETSSKLNIGYFTQHRLEHLDANKSPIEHLQELAPQASLQQIRNFLGGFGFSGDMALSKIIYYSEGEKARLSLALIGWQRPNLLLLDEPTNHLDMDMQNALINALKNYSGAVVIISHDRYLLKTSVDELYLVTNGQAKYFDGNLTNYQEYLLASSSENLSIKNPPKESQQAFNKKKAQQQKIERIEKRLDKLSEQLLAVEQILSDNAIYSPENKEQLASILAEQKELKQEIQQAEQEWNNAVDEL